MCQSIKDGGLRCDVHRDDTRIAARLAAKSTLLNSQQVDDVFVALKGVGSSLRDVSVDDEEYHNYVEGLQQEAAQTLGADSAYVKMSRTLDGAILPSAPAFYAMVRLRAECEEVSQRLADVIDNIAPNVGMGFTQGLEAYRRLRAEAAQQSPQQTSEYTASAREDAINAGLPHDRASVVALSRLRGSAVVGERVVRSFVALGGVSVEGAGYDEESGRLEVALHETSQTQAYAGVPTQLWEELVSSPHPDAVYQRNIRGRADFLYDSEQQDQAQRNTVRCMSCGRFSSSSHSCPQRDGGETGKAQSPAPAPDVFTVISPDQVVYAPSMGDPEKDDVDIAMETLSALTSDELFSVSGLSTHARAYHKEDFSRTFYIESAGSSVTIDTVPAESAGHGTVIPMTVSGGDVVIAHGTSETGDKFSAYLGQSPIGVQVRSGEDDGSGERSLTVYSEPRGESAPEFSPISAQDRIAAQPFRGHKVDLGQSGDIVDKDNNVLMSVTARLHKPRTINLVDEGSVQSVRARMTFSGQDLVTPDGAFLSGEEATVDVTVEVENVGGTLQASPERVRYRCPTCDSKGRTCYHVQFAVSRLTQALPTPPARADRALGNQDVNNVITVDPGCVGEVVDGRSLVGADTVVSILPSHIDQAAFYALTQPRAASLGNPDMSMVEPSDDARSSARSALVAGATVAMAHSFSVTDAKLGERELSGEVVYTQSPGGAVAASTVRMRCSCGRFVSATKPCDHIIQAKVMAQGYANQYLTLSPCRPEEDSFYDTSAHLLNVYSQEVDIELAAQQKQDEHFKETGEVLDPDIARDLAEEEALEQEMNSQLMRDMQRQEEQDRITGDPSLYEELVKDEVEKNRDTKFQFADENPQLIDDYFTYDTDRIMRWEEAEAGYAGQMDKLMSDITQAQDDRGKRRVINQPLTHGVTDGVCAPGPGARRFGLEIEFMLPHNVNKKETMAAILADLRESGLTDSSAVGGYHEGQKTGWKSWSLEEDISVSGELVTPPLSDTEGDWNQVRTALAILKKHGARASVEAGCHVNISSGNFLGDTSKNAEVIRKFKEHEDILFRAGGDPRVGEHRGIAFCPPNVELGAATVKADDGYSTPIFLASEHSRESAVNIANSVNTDEGSRIEFRHWDSSLDLATIQTQVATSAALTDYADRVVDEQDGQSHPRQKDQNLMWGSTSEELLTEDDADRGMSEKSTASLITFVDSVFRRQGDRERFVRLFAVNKWVG